MGRFVEMYKRSLKVDSDKRKVVVLGGEERLGCEVYGIDTMIWKEERRSRIRVVQIDNLKGLLGIRSKGTVWSDEGIKERIGKVVLR